MRTTINRSFLDENEFKNWYRKNVLAKQNTRVFNIETEETVKGFPDTVYFDTDKRASLYEFKVCDLSGDVKFTFNQPRFYRQHADVLDIYLVALDNIAREYYTIKLTSKTIKGQVLNIRSLEI